MSLSSLESAAAQSIDWAVLLGGAANETGYSVATDFDGSVVVAGSFEGTTDIGGVQLVSTGYSDVFIAKFAGDGTVRWVKQLGGISTDQPAAVAVDAETGDVIVTGEFPLAATVDGQTVHSAGSTDVFVARFSKAGALQWTLTFGGAGADVAAGVAVNANGDSLVTGQFSGSFACGPTTLLSAGGVDIFVAAVTESGAIRWCRRYGGAFDDEVSGIAVGDGGLFALTGAFGSESDLGGGRVVSDGQFDAFVAAYAIDSGNYRWGRRLGGNGYDGGRALAFDSAGALVVTGYFGLFGDSIDFGGGTFAARGGADAFVVKYDGSDGRYAWARTFGGSLDDYANGVSVDRDGTIAVVGEFQGAATFAGLSAVSRGQFDAFVARYAVDGTPLWWQSYGDVINDKAYGVSVDFEGNCFVTGFSLYRIDLGSGALFSAGMSDAFLIKLAAPVVDTPTPTPTPTSTLPPPTSTRTFTPPPTFTSTPAPTFTFTPTSAVALGCAVDCNGDGTVTVGELVIGINIVMGRAPLTSCRVSDTNEDGLVTVDEVVAAVRSALSGCL